MNDPQELQFGMPFILHIKTDIKKGTDVYELEKWLDKNGFKHDDEKHNWFYHTYVLCDNLTDAAKIETYIQTP